MQVKTFLEGQRERALAYLETLVRHQKRVFTSNSRSAADCLSLEFPSRITINNYYYSSTLFAT